MPDSWVEYFALSSADLAHHHWLALLGRLISYQFMHAGSSHFKYNFLVAIAPCLYLEKRLGKLSFLSFYLFAGMMSGIVYCLVMPGSPVGQMFAEQGVPMSCVGASGSIYGCMLMAAALWGKEGLWNICLSGMFVGFFAIEQVQLAILSLSQAQGTAYWGHVGGMLGALICLPLVLMYDYKRRA